MAKRQADTFSLSAMDVMVRTANMPDNVRGIFLTLVLMQGAYGGIRSKEAPNASVRAEIEAGMPILGDHFVKAEDGWTYEDVAEQQERQRSFRERCSKFGKKGGAGKHASRVPQGYPKGTLRNPTGPGVSEGSESVGDTVPESKRSKGMLRNPTGTGDAEGLANSQGYPKGMLRNPTGPGVSEGSESEQLEAVGKVSGKGTLKNPVAPMVPRVPLEPPSSTIYKAGKDVIDKENTVKPNNIKAQGAAKKIAYTAATFDERRKRFVDHVATVNDKHKILSAEELSVFLLHFTATNPDCYKMLYEMQKEKKGVWSPLGRLNTWRITSDRYGNNAKAWKNTTTSTPPSNSKDIDDKW